MLLIFSSDPLEPMVADESIQSEYIAAGRFGLPTFLIDTDVLIYENQAITAVASIDRQFKTETGIYRGRALRPQHYKILYEALLRKKIKLINTPHQYQTCSYFPQSYPYIKTLTPRSIWTTDTKKFQPLLQLFGNRPIVVRDFLQCAKFRWDTAAFIEDASASRKVKKVVNEFLKFRGKELHCGLVFREFLQFEKIDRIFVSGGLNLCQEFRLFFLDKRCIFWFKYWGETVYFSNPPINRFHEIASRIPSRFFTMDVAKLQGSQDWRIIELSDGQIANIPESSVNTFFRHVSAARSS